MASNNVFNSEESIFNECFDIVKSTKTVAIPCSTNIREAYTVKVPKTKTVKVNKQVPYIDYETRIKQVPVQYFERQTVVRNVPTYQTVPTVKKVCTTIPVKRGLLGGLFARRPSYVNKKCPRTVYITKMCCQPRQFCQSIPVTGLRRVQENVPVQKFKTQTELKHMTEYVPEVRYRSRKVNKVVKKTVPVYSLVPKTPAPPGKERMLQTIPVPEVKTAIPTIIRARTEPIRGSTIPYNVVHTSQDARMYNTGYNIPRKAYANIGYEIPAQFGKRYNVYGPSMALATDTKLNDKNGEATLVYQEDFDATNTNRDKVSNSVEHGRKDLDGTLVYQEDFDAANSNQNVLSNSVEYGRDYTQNIERYDIGYQGQSRVDYQPVGVLGVQVKAGGVGAGVDLGQQTL